MNKTPFLLVLLTIIIVCSLIPVQAFDQGSIYDLAKETGRNFHYNGACILSNGDYFVVCQNTTLHSISATSKISSFRSTDNGATWVGDEDIYNNDGTYYPNGATVGVSPNGTVVVMIQVGLGLSPGANDWQVWYKRSFDNAVTWTSLLKLNESNEYPLGIANTFITKDNVMMFVTEDVYGPLDDPNELYVSSDNGATWNQRSLIQENTYATYGTSAIDPNNGSILYVNHNTGTGEGELRWSEDDGYTWGDSVTLTYDGSPFFLRDPDVHIYGNEVIIHGRVRVSGVYYFGYFDTPISSLPVFANRTYVEDATNHGAYSSGFNEANNSLFIVYSDIYSGDLAELKRIRLTDFTGLPYIDGDIQFISIEGETDGALIYTATPTFNWTNISDASRYWLQIDDESDFNSPWTVNLTNINEYTYPTKYSANATRVSFILPDANSLPFGYYYCRVRAFT